MANELNKLFYFRSLKGCHNLKISHQGLLLSVITCELWIKIHLFDGCLSLGRSPIPKRVIFSVLWNSHIGGKNGIMQQLWNFQTKSNETCLAIQPFSFSIFSRRQVRAFQKGRFFVNLCREMLLGLNLNLYYSNYQF